MASPTSSDLPQLAPPGAGLPPAELFAARALFKWRRLTTSRHAAESNILAERAAILALVESCDAGLRAQRVLIPRPRGLEDSSRHWSIFMTLDHLRIVNRGAAAIVGELVAGRVPDRAASTGAVKPSPAAEATVVNDFIESCDELVRAGRNAHSLRTRARYAHPWFGPLDAAGWHLLGGVHLRLHRGQLNLILAGLAQAAGG